MNVKITQSSLAPVLVSMASVPSDHNHSGLNTRLFSCSLEVRSLTWVSLDEDQVWAFSLEAQGRICSLPFPASKGTCIPWLVAPSSVFKASNASL